MNEFQSPTQPPSKVAIEINCAIEGNLSELFLIFSVDESKWYKDAEIMMQETKPDVLSFSTMPHIRKEYVELAVKYKVKGLLMEKPMAVSVDDAKYIIDLCNDNGIKASVSHQHKYFDAFIELRSRIDSGELGTIMKEMKWRECKLKCDLVT